MSRPEVEVRSGAGALASLEPAWQALFRQAEAPPFLSWTWVEAWHRHLGTGRQPQTVCVRDGGALTGVLPLCEESLRLPGLGRPVRRLSLAGERYGGADYLEVLARADARERATRAVFDHLAREARFDVLDLDGVAADAAALPAAMRAFADPSRFVRRLVPRYVCPQIDLRGGFAAVLRHSSRAENFKRRLKQLRARPGFELRPVTSPDESAAAFERFLDLHDRRWAEQGGSDAMGRPAIRAFQREIVRRLAAAGALRFDELWVEGGCRASIYGIERKGVFYFYQTGYDPAWAARSVGLVLLGLSIEAAAERGAGLYDFLHGSEPYKLEWATHSRQTVCISVASRGLAPALFRLREGAAAATRAAAHSILPAPAVERIRRWRRAREQGALA